MSRFAHISVIASVVILTASLAGSEPLIRVGASFGLGYPQEEFRDNVDNTGMGGGLFAAVGFSDAPFAFGGSFEIMEYGSEEREAPWSTTIPDVFVNVRTTNDIIAAQFFARLQPPSGFFQPYVEGFLGFNYLSTTTSVSDQGDDDEAIASTKHLSDIAFSYGAGAGVAVRVWRPSKDPVHEEEGETAGLAEDDADDDVGVESVQIFLDVRYMRGGEAEYLKEGSITVDDGRVHYDVLHSRTDMVLFRIGVSVSLI
jgi:hypothetical protein